MAGRFVSAAVLPKWRAANASSFLPPVCNKLLHRGQLSIMGVGGPNTRTDFHLERGAEFFWQHDGELQLPIIEQGRRRVVRVEAGEIFLLPPNIPHSPQRSAGSFGFVVERQRAAGGPRHRPARARAWFRRRTPRTFMIAPSPLVTPATLCLTPQTSWMAYAGTPTLSGVTRCSGRGRSTAQT